MSETDSLRSCTASIAGPTRVVPPVVLPTASGPSQRFAASYARTAKADPRAIARQHATNVAAAARDGFVVPAEPCFVWDDDAWSGAELVRPALGALLVAVETGHAPFTRLYVADQHRLSRSSDFRVLVSLELRLEAGGVSVHYAEIAPRNEQLAEDLQGGVNLRPWGQDDVGRTAQS